ALDNLNSNHWCVCQERLRASPLQKGKKKKTSGYFFIEVLTLPLACLSRAIAWLHHPITGRDQ
ncbi:hypothetical protein KGR20_23660, partial [Cytobacillus oceanisediminis]|nr:hypothetical protein [Cytobacillus oceanisediminis]